MEADRHGNVDKAKIMASVPSNLHKGSYGGGGDVDIEGMIEKSGCSKVYYALEECLGENDRRWAMCQREVAQLKECNVAKALLQAKPKQNNE